MAVASKLEGAKVRAIIFQMVTDINDRHPNLMPVDYSFGEVTHMIVIFPF